MNFQPLESRMTIEFNDIKIKLYPISETLYGDIISLTIPIHENYTHYLRLIKYLEIYAPDFDYPRHYAALKTLFGDSTLLYDYYKCSFEYIFLLKINKKQTKSLYLLNYTDIKGSFCFLFHKILISQEELIRYPEKHRCNLFEPLEHEFSKSDMEFFMNYFLFYLVGYFETIEHLYKDEFIRYHNYCQMIYGYKDNHFFCNQYNSYNEYINERKKNYRPNGTSDFKTIDIIIVISYLHKYKTRKFAFSSSGDAGN